MRKKFGGDILESMQQGDKILVKAFLVMVCVTMVGIPLIRHWPFEMNPYFQCPNEYSSTDNYVEGMARWIQEEIRKNSEITTDELVEKRERLFYRYDCEKSYWGSFVNFDESNNASAGVDENNHWDREVPLV